MVGQLAEGVVLEGLRPRSLHRALAEPAELVIGRGDGAVGEGSCFLLQLQGAQRAHRHVGELRGADTVGARDQAREVRVPGEADIGRGIDDAGVGDGRQPVVLGVAVGLDLACRVGDGFQAAGRGLVGVGDGAGVGILLAGQPASPCRALTDKRS